MYTKTVQMMEVASGDEENLQLRVATRRNSTAEGHVPSPLFTIR